MTKVTGSTIAAGFYGFIDDNAGKTFFPTRLFTVTIPVAQAIIGAQKGWSAQNSLRKDLNTKKLDLTSSAINADDIKKDIKTIEKQLNNRGVAAVAGLIKGLFFGIIDALVFLYNPVAFARNNHPKYIANRQEYLDCVKGCLTDTKGITDLIEKAAVQQKNAALTKLAKKWIDETCLKDFVTEQLDIEDTVKNKMAEFSAEYDLQKAREDINEKLDAFKPNKNLYVEMISLIKKATLKELQQGNAVEMLKKQAEHRIALRNTLEKFEEATAADLLKADADQVLVDLNKVTDLSAEQKKHVIAETRKAINDLALDTDTDVALSDIYEPIAHAKVQADADADAHAKIEKEIKETQAALVKTVLEFDFTQFSKTTPDTFGVNALTDDDIKAASDNIIASIKSIVDLETLQKFSVNGRVKEIADSKKWTSSKIDNP